MMNPKAFFHYISYLQYPLMMVAVYFLVQTYFGMDFSEEGRDIVFKNLNTVLIFLGLGVSFSSLQDTSKTQNEFSKKIWQDPLKGKIALFLISGLILIVLIYGLFAYFRAEGMLKDISVGIIVIGIGMIGLLKAAIEMFENHRSDRNIVSAEKD